VLCCFTTLVFAQGLLHQTLLQGVHLFLDTFGQAITELLGEILHFLHLLAPLLFVHVKQLPQSFFGDIQTRSVQGSFFRYETDGSFLCIACLSVTLFEDPL